MVLQDNSTSAPEITFQLVQPLESMPSSSTPRPRTSAGTTATISNSASGTGRRKSSSALSKQRAGQSSCMGIISSFPIIQEVPKKPKSKLHSTDIMAGANGDSAATPQTPSTAARSYAAQPSSDQQLHQQFQHHHQQQQRPRTSELRIKMESVGTQLEEDDDLDTCPARTRAVWPRQIIPWWEPNHPFEKPPYSYAALIAYAILSSKDGRLTLSDIYKWISTQYPCFVLGQHNWQNSIRHNLSLNKNKFLKLDRRPTQANPGKGSYWTLVPGSEESFIAQLTQACGHSRKHHDVGLTAELSIATNRRGSLFANRCADDSSTGSTALSHGNMVIMRPEDYEARKKTPPPSSASSATKGAASTSAFSTSGTGTSSSGSQGMYTIFRMASTSSAAAAELDDKKVKRENGSFHKQRTNKKRRPQQRPHQQKQEHTDATGRSASDSNSSNNCRRSSDAGYDSGVDVKPTCMYSKNAHDDLVTSAAVDEIFGSGFSWQDSLLDVAGPLANLDINGSTFLNCYLSQQEPQCEQQPQDSNALSLSANLNGNDWSLPVGVASDWFHTGTMSTPVYMTSSCSSSSLSPRATATPIAQPLLDHSSTAIAQWDQQQEHSWANDIISGNTGLPVSSSSSSSSSSSFCDHARFVFEDAIQPSLSYPTLLASKYEPPQQHNSTFHGTNSDSIVSKIADVSVEDCLKELVSYQQKLQEQQQQQQQQQQRPKQNPIVINLDDEVTNQYLHFEDADDDDEDEDDVNDDDQEADQAPSSLCPNDTPSSVLKEYNSSISMPEFLSHL